MQELAIYNALRAPLAQLPTISAKLAEALTKELGLHTLLDLLQFYPYRYEDRSKIYQIRELKKGELQSSVQLKGVLRDLQQVGTGRNRRLTATFHDATGSISLVWFRSITQMQRLYIPGKEYILFGKPTLFNNTLTISHPELEDEQKRGIYQQGLVPIYTSSEKARRKGITNKRLRQMIYQSLELVYHHLPDHLPEEILREGRFMPYKEALKEVHFPSDKSRLEEARKRLKSEELLAIQLKIQQLKVQRMQSYVGYRFETVGPLFNKLYKELLPFDLTTAQKRVLREIRSDCNTGIQMNRLIQGDVGSGKTIVALFAMLLAIDNGYQASMMAPTEILARQHYASLKDFTDKLGLRMEVLTGSSRARERRVILEDLAKGEIDILIGTHALIEDAVQFKNIGIAIIDEQHRFGVDQRARLWGKSMQAPPHILIMSATPIPRTLAMTLYGDLDVSIIDELPPGRKPIQTIHQPENRMFEVFQFLRSEIARGRQAYVVFPMIEENEKAGYMALESGYERYREALPELKIGFVHGKLKAQEKEEVMQAFALGELDILLSTTVIEVGVNVPNASVMVIESANLFGLSQLHQLRGRVGRGAEQSYCLLVTPTKLGEYAMQRISTMVNTNDGFEIAEVDMALRGFGELAGTRQSGQQLSLKIASLSQDSLLVQYTRYLAEKILSEDPKLESSKYSSLKLYLELLSESSTDYSAIS